MDATFVFCFFLFSQLRSSPVSVEFDFNAQLKRGKLASIIASVDLIRMKKGSLFTDIICALFLLCLPLRSS